MKQTRKIVADNLEIIIDVDQKLDPDYTADNLTEHMDGVASDVMLAISRRGYQLSKMKVEAEAE
jgi:hypothetical protein